MKFGEKEGKIGLGLLVQSQSKECGRKIYRVHQLAAEGMSYVYLDLPPDLRQQW